MKKFYAILAVAVAATSVASAQLPSLSIDKAHLVPITDVTLSEVPAAVNHGNFVAADIKGQSIRKAPSRAGENDGVWGEYLFTYIDTESPFTTRFLTTKINPGESSDAVVTDLYYADAEALPASIEWKDIQFSSGTVNLPVLSIKGLSNGPTPYLIIDLDEDGADETYYLALYDYVERKLYGDDLQWVIDPESGEGLFWFGTDCGLSFWAPTDDGKWSGYLMDQGAELYKKNAEMTALFYAGEDGFEEATCPVWTYVIEGNYTDTGDPFKAVFAAGWGGCGDSFHFMIEDVEGTYVAAAYDQVGWTDGNGQEFVFCDIELDDNGEPGFAWTDNSGEGLDWMIAAISTDAEGNTVFTQDGLWTLFSDAGLLTYWKEGITQFDYYIGVGAGEGDGIQAIEGNDANAPAEYYNLQGVKVANPTPGQLYIVKQGSKVSKIIR